MTRDIDGDIDVMIANAPYLSASVKHNFLRAATAYGQLKPNDLTKYPCVNTP